jgi:phosphohistidine phosphatase
MDLILWRHADAREGHETLPDLDRPLTAKGERQAHRMAQWLNRHLPESTRVIVSPAQRTRQTADALNRKYRLCPELSPERSVTELLQAARWPDAKGPVLVVGHQPALGLAAAWLLGGGLSADQLQPWALRKGAVWWLRSREREARVEVVLHTVMPVELL